MTSSPLNNSVNINELALDSALDALANFLDEVLLEKKQDITRVLEKKITYSQNEDNIKKENLVETKNINESILHHIERKEVQDDLGSTEKHDIDFDKENITEISETMNEKRNDSKKKDIEPQILKEPLQHLLFDDHDKLKLIQDTNFLILKETTDKEDSILKDSSKISCLETNASLSSTDPNKYEAKELRNALIDELALECLIDKLANDLNYDQLLTDIIFFYRGPSSKKLVKTRQA